MTMSAKINRRGLTKRVLVSAALVSVLLTGCAMSPLNAPQAWQKGALAKPEMSMNNDPLDQAFTQHIYTSKESASGGYGVGGGGCGCN